MRIAIAGATGILVDLAFQAANQLYDEEKIDFSKINYGRALKIGAQTAIGTAVPALKGVSGLVDPIGTALIWGEESVAIAVMDVITTNIFF